MLFKPSLIIEGTLTSLDIALLREKGIKGLILDLDNTVMPPHTGEIDEHMVHWLGEARKHFQLIIVTNNKRSHYYEKAGELLGLPVIGSAGKPDLACFRQALDMLELDHTQVAVIGDRPLTDVWGGLRLNAFTILVDPLTKETEHPVIKFLRALERSLVRNA